MMSLWSKNAGVVLIPYTPWKTNMAPENHWLVEETHLPNNPLSGSMLVFGSVLTYDFAVHDPGYPCLLSVPLSSAGRLGGELHRVLHRGWRSPRLAA